MKPDHRETPKPFHIQRRRLGVIKHMEPDGKYGFIEAEDFRENVFFHHSVWQGELRGVVRKPVAGAYVEFEIDEEYRAREKKLRATVVRLTDRPMGKRLEARDTPHLINPHHRNARRKRPTWRGKPNGASDSPGPAEPASDQPQPE